MKGKPPLPVFANSSHFNKGEGKEAHRGKEERKKGMEKGRKVKRKQETKQLKYHMKLVPGSRC